MDVRNDYKEIERVCCVHLDDLSDGVRRASVGNVRPGLVLVVRDGVSMAYMGRPFASYPLHLMKSRERIPYDHSSISSCRKCKR